MRIVTYNFLRAGSLNRCGHWSRVVRTLKADMVLAQECRPPQNSPREPFRHSENDAFAWQSAANRNWGTGLWARSASLLPIQIPNYEAWVVGGEIRGVRVSTRRLIVFSIHGPVGDRGYIHTIHDILDRLAPFRRKADLILGGDFNVAVGYRRLGERVSMLRGERDILDRLSNEFQLMSCWQAANPNRRLAQTLRWMGNPSAPYHCDGIFVPRSWLPLLVACRVVRGARWKQLSDHNPVIADFGSPSGSRDTARSELW